MNKFIQVKYHGGPKDGEIEHVDRTAFDDWINAFPFGEFYHGSRLHLYQSYTSFSDEDEVVAVYYAGLVDGLTGDGDAYDGWLLPSDRYEGDDGR